MSRHSRRRRKFRWRYAQLPWWVRLWRWLRRHDHPWEAGGEMTPKG
jgi:hypothetical protein